MKPNIANQLRDEAVTQALQTIERRVNELGVAEPIVARQGGEDQILVQLPGVSDVQRAKEIIRSTALLELKLVEQGPFPIEEAALQGVQQRRCRPTCVIVPGSADGAARRRARRHGVLRRAARVGRSPAATCATPGRRSTRTTCRPWASR